MKYQIHDDPKIKVIKSKKFNHYFNKETGLSITFGATESEDPAYCPIGPLIADIEIVSMCNGVRDANGDRQPCAFCYKSNTPQGNYMSLKTYEIVLDRLTQTKTLGQVALGVDAQGILNPDLIAIMEHTRAKHVIPNLTIADVDDDIAKQIARLAGACAVSVYPNRDVNRCYDTVEKLTSYGMDQVNIHMMISNESYNDVFKVFDAIENDSRLNKLNAIVLLALKQQGRGRNFTSLGFGKFKTIVDAALERGISFGFDSCSAGMFLKAVENTNRFEQFKSLAEPCESTLFSAYVNDAGMFFPCSFTENGIYGCVDWTTGLNVVECENFIEDVWMHPKQERKYLHNDNVKIVVLHMTL